MIVSRLRGRPWLAVSAAEVAAAAEAAAADEVAARDEATEAQGSLERDLSSRDQSPARKCCNYKSHEIPHLAPSRREDEIRRDVLFAELLGNVQTERAILIIDATLVEIVQGGICPIYLLELQKKIHDMQD